MTSPESEPASAATVPYRHLALASAVFGIASLAVLVVITTIRDVDVLSVVAMVLAVLAFVVQIIVFLFQTAEAGRQARDGHELHSQLVALVSRVEERTHGTAVTVDRMNEHLIANHLEKSRSEGHGLKETARELASAVKSPTASMLGEPDQRSHGQPTPESRPKYRKPLDPAEAAAIRTRLARWPSKNEVDEVVSALGSLNERERRQIYRFGRDLWESTDRDSGLGPGLRNFSAHRLIDLGYVERGEDGIHSLTPEGVRLARVATARGLLPPGREAIRRFREEAEAAKAESDARRRGMSTES